MDGQNDLRKMASYIGFKRARQLQKLKLGEFFYDMGSKTEWISTKESKSGNKPKSLPTCS